MRACNREIWQGAQGRLHAGNNTVEIKKKKNWIGNSTEKMKEDTLE